MAKSTKSKRTSWKAKAMGALALAAVFGLPMGTAGAEDKAVANATEWNSLFANGVYELPATDTVTVNTGITMDGNTLKVGDLIIGSTAVDNGDMAFTGNNKLTFTGGRIEAGTLSIYGTEVSQLNLEGTANTIIHIGGTASQNAGSISAREFNYYSKNGMHIQNTIIELADSGTFNLVPANASSVLSGYTGSTFAGYSRDKPAVGWNSELLMTGGTLNMDATSQAGYGRIIELDSVDISGGTVNIGGYYTATNKYGSTLYGDWDGYFRVRGNAEINLDDYGTIGTYAVGSSEDIAVEDTRGIEILIDISGGTINMAGESNSASAIRATSMNPTRTSATAPNGPNPYKSWSNGAVKISGDADINVLANKYGAIVARESTMAGGTINVLGNLMVSGGAVNSGDIFSAIKVVTDNNWDSNGAGAQQWGDFYFNGGSIKVDDSGKLLFGQNMILHTGGGTLEGRLAVKAVTDSGDMTGAEAGSAVAPEVIVEAGGLTVTDLDLSAAAADKFKTSTASGTVTVTNDLTIAGSSVANKALVLNSLMNVGNDLDLRITSGTFSDGALIVAETGTLNIGRDVLLSSAVANSLVVNGTMNILNLKLADAATAGSVSLNGNMVVTGTVSADAETGDGVIAMGANGTLTANFSDFLKADYSAQANMDELINAAAAGAIVNLRGNGPTYTTEQWKKATAAIGNENLTVVFMDSEISDLEDQAAETDGTDDSKVTASIPTTTTQEVKVTNAQGTLTISKPLVAGSLAVEAAAGKTVEAVKVTDATLTGSSASDALVHDAQGSSLDLEVGNTEASASAKLTLGNSGGTGKVQSGTVGNITLAAAGTGGNTSTTLNVNDGVFKAGEIKATATNTAVAVNVNNTGLSAANQTTKLETEGIDLSSVTAAAEVVLTKAEVSTKGNAVKVGGTGASVDHELTLANASSLTTGSGNIEFGNTTTGGSNILTVDAKSNLQAGNLVFGNAATANEMTVADSTVKVNDITFNSTTGYNTLEVVGSHLTAGAISGNATKSVAISVGDADKAGQIVAASVTNAEIVLDPLFVDGTNNDSSYMLVGGMTDTSLAVLQNSWFMVNNTAGMTTTEAEAEANAWMARHIPGGELKTGTGFYTAALAIRKAITLADDQYLGVNGIQGDSNPYAHATDDNNADFAANSLLLVDVGAIGTATALTGADGNGNLTVAASAALKLIGGKPGETYTIVDGFGGTKTIDGWGHTDFEDGTVKFDTDLLYVAEQADLGLTGDAYKVTVSQKAAASVFPDLSSGMAGLVDDIIRGGDYNPNQANAGLEFVSRILSNDYIGADNATEAARVLEGAARVVAAAGVPTLAANLNTQVSSLIVGHNSMLNDAQPAYGSEPGQLGLWLSPFYGSSDVDGMKAGKFENGYEMNYGGAAFGLDYNVSESFRLGLALNAGGGDSESEGDFNKTENDFDFWGLNLYSSYSNGAFGLTGDIGYTMLNSEITQKIPASLQEGNELRADGDSDIFTVGLTGEYRVSTASGFAVTPHAGLRYSKISTDNVDVKLAGNGGDVFEIDTDDQNLFQIPLGVKFGKDIVTDGGWTVSPSADLGVLFTMGDTDVDSKATIAGTSYSGVTNTEVVDKAAFTGALGLQAKADNGLSLGLEYGLLAGGNQTDHQLSGMLRFEF